VRIVIDMQGAQSEKRVHDIGCYTLLLAQDIVRNRGDNQVILALCGLFPSTIESIRAEFHELLPRENIRVWYTVGSMSLSEQRSEWQSNVAELIREEFLASLNPDVVLVPSFFEICHSKAVFSVSVFAKSLITVVGVDSLNPFQANEISYRENIDMLRKLEQLKRANLLIALQSVTVDNLCQCLGIPLERVKTGLMIYDSETDVKNASTEALNLVRIFEDMLVAQVKTGDLPSYSRPKLAFVSPLPPEKSGISDYSAELLPELARFYDIDVIVAQENITVPWIVANCGIRTVDWFLQHSRRYSRVLYHFGNSPYHSYMFNLLDQVAGVVVLHDFYLGNLQRYREEQDTYSCAWTKALYESHGWSAVAERFNVSDGIELKYPANLEVLQHAIGVIAHSEYSLNLATHWYGKEFSADWAVIPLLRVPSQVGNRNDERQNLRLKSDDFVICTFGMLGPAKLNHRLLEAWLLSRLINDTNCILVFVGEVPEDAYGKQILETIRSAGMGDRLRITGWVDMSTFRRYLTVADLAVQFRSQSRGETSAAVLDCMNYAIPTIVNANGAMSEFPSDAVYMLPDEFELDQLVDTLEKLWRDSNTRIALGQRAKEFISSRHLPHVCAQKYADKIEQFYAREHSDYRSLINIIADLPNDYPSEAECLELAKSISHNMPVAKPTRQLLVDVSAICQNDLETGIQRVVRALLWELLQAPPLGYRVEPVYLTVQGQCWNYRYARSWTSGVLGIPRGLLPDELIEHASGDVMLVADFTGGLAVIANNAGVFAQLKNDGVELCFVVYDLLPVQMPNFFPPGQFDYLDWLNTVSSVADRVICISKDVANEMKSWVEISGFSRLLPMKICWFHLGADINNSVPTCGLPNNADRILCQIQARTSFLMVGTIEPRKGYLQTIEAFTQLWLDGVDVNLVIVGKEGWQGLQDELRRNILEIACAILNHPELNKKLIWLKGISDEYLEIVYAASTCLIAASEGEGFGLPLIEAAQHKKPIIARDIPVFRELAGESAFYFGGLSSLAMAVSIVEWIELYKHNSHPKSEAMPYLTWQESAAQLKLQLGL